MEYDHVAVQRLGAAPGVFSISGSGDSPIIETVRTFFPETWIWDLVEVGYVFVLKGTDGIFKGHGL